MVWAGCQLPADMGVSCPSRSGSHLQRTQLGNHYKRYLVFLIALTIKCSTFYGVEYLCNSRGTNMVRLRYDYAMIVS